MTDATKVGFEPKADMRTKSRLTLSSLGYAQRQAKF